MNNMDKVNARNDSIQNLLDGKGSVTEVNESTAELPQSNREATDAIGDAAQSMSALPGTSMSGPAPQNPLDLKISGVTEVVNQSSKPDGCVTSVHGCS